MIGHTLRTSTLAALVVGLAACASGTPVQPRTAAPASQSGTMGDSGMGQMDMNQMMAHCRAMMAQPNQGGTPATR
jgi:hypothetical protein